jgi:hypothetical protein
MKIAEALANKIIDTLDHTNGITKVPNAQYMIANYQGNGDKVPANFRVSIYQGRKGYSVVSTCEQELQELISGRNPWNKKTKRIVQIDDAGFGCIIAGVMIGLYDRHNGRIHTEIIPPEIFRKNRQVYLRAVTQACLNLLQRTGIKKDGTIIEMCTSYVFTDAREKLRKAGWDVRSAQIKGYFQDRLEAEYKQYMKKEFEIPDGLEITDYMSLYHYYRRRIEKEPELVKHVMWIKVFENINSQGGE